MRCSSEYLRTRHSPVKPGVNWPSSATAKGIGKAPSTPLRTPSACRSNTPARTRRHLKSSAS